MLFAATVGDYLPVVGIVLQCIGIAMAGASLACRGMATQGDMDCFLAQLLVLLKRHA